MFHVEHRRETALQKGLMAVQEKLHKKTAAEKPLTISKA